MSGISVGKIEDGGYLVDLRAWMCPYPKYMLKPLIDKLPGDAKRLVMMVDCPSAIEDVPKVARSLGYGKSNVRQTGSGDWEISIELAKA